MMVLTASRAASGAEATTPAGAASGAATAGAARPSPAWPTPAFYWALKALPAARTAAKVSAPNLKSKLYKYVP